ncbi:hypothetical protein DAEQUDRAFT_720690 [Daedalea quercina L-15889]|uniref:Zn(2)-C6 fungal-type domain-containing protein n=1 Tax=Daedalea quercina L-15889 TaxID=1314783 RepID=A0A165U7K0_9APHY|nr:hypothetical protein DAEQUDRAFT_720690 [Daedalea quercina L-15889]
MSKAEDKPAARPNKLRRPHSPGAPDAEDGDRPGSETRQPPTKRARKAINCEPCRNSKLKCDRNRPCSSCVLRGTTSQCYQGQDSAPTNQDEPRPLDPLSEISRIRQSLVQLESYIKVDSSNIRPIIGYAHLPPSAQSGAHPLAPLAARLDLLTRGKGGDRGPQLDRHKVESSPMVGTPGMFGGRGIGGLYVGPTTPGSLMVGNHDRDEQEPDGATSHIEELVEPFSEYDDDFVRQLPPFDTIDSLIAYYFDYCNWIYRHVNEKSFLDGWTRFKTGQSGDRIVLATACIVMCLALRYLPAGHPLLERMGPGTVEEHSNKYHALMRNVLKRHRDHAESLTRTYTLPLVELLLAQSHYLTFAKEDPEEVWKLAGELISIGTAMGLHRDPGKHKFERHVAERRRWAWWHIILFERWQAFMFGRPLHVASHHFETNLPTVRDPDIEKAVGRLHLPNLALFKLAFILGHIMDDAVSFKTIQYTSVQEKDKMLTEWYNDLPAELKLDEYALRAGLLSGDKETRRLAVQSVIDRCAHLHIRFTLHRPYIKVQTSLDAAVESASELITLSAHAYSVQVAQGAQGVPGHLNWFPFHVFSAAMFFSFQLITNPDVPGKDAFREQVRKAMALLERARWLPVAEKALTILQALQPLYSEELVMQPAEQRALKKAEVLKVVKTLAFPYQDPPTGREADAPRGAAYAPSAQLGGALAQAGVPQQQRMDGWMAQAQRQPPAMQAYAQAPMSARPMQKSLPMQAPPPPTDALPYSHAQAMQTQQPSASGGMAGMLSQMAGGQMASQTYSQMNMGGYTMAGMPAMMPQRSMQQQPSQQPPQQQHHAQAHSYSTAAATAATMDGQNGQLTAYMPPAPADESSMWGASVGFGMTEWAQFLDVVARPEGEQQGH